MAGMDLVLVRDNEKAAEQLEEARVALDLYGGPDCNTPFDKRVRAEAEAILKAAETVESTDAKVIDLVGTVRRSYQLFREGRAGAWDGEYHDWPKLAVVDARFATKEILCRSYRDGSLRLGTSFKGLDLPAGTDPKPATRPRFTQASTYAPPIPPMYRPLVKPGILLLWEVEGWRAEEKHVPPPAPIDPALLERVGGPDSFLYKVIAEWDLTEIERRCMIPV